jgi:hypothetical protein
VWARDLSVGQATRRGGAAHRRRQAWRQRPCAPAASWSSAFRVGVCSCGTRREQVGDRAAYGRCGRINVLAIFTGQTASDQQWRACRRPTRCGGRAMLSDSLSALGCCRRRRRAYGKCIRFMLEMAPKHQAPKNLQEKFAVSNYIRWLLNLQLSGSPPAAAAMHVGSRDRMLVPPLLPAGPGPAGKAHPSAVSSCSQALPARG